MQQRCNLAYLILGGVVVLMLTPLMADAVPQAQIAFTSKREGIFHGHRQIYVMDADGNNPRRVINKPFHSFSHWDPSWSPNGKHIAFVSNRDSNFEIYVMDADGDNQRNLTNNPHADTEPAWFDPAFAVAPAAKKFTIWGWLKQDVQ